MANPKIIRGRPSTYNPAWHPKIAYYMAAVGKKDKDMAEEFGIDVSCLKQWKNRYPDFLAAIKKGKDDPDSAIEGSMFQRCRGYYVTETTTETEEGTRGTVTKTKKNKRYIPPDTVAQIFWLKNRKPSEWREKKEIQLIDDDKELTDAELEKIEAAIADRARLKR